MKILRITAQGLPLFKKDLDICFYTQQRVCEEDKDSLYRLTDNYYLHSACAFIGINASGKTSVLKVISLALNIVKNEPINHVEAKSILGGTKKATIRTYFYDKRSYVCCLETVIAAKKSKTGEYVYSILSESLWEKPIATVKSKKYLTDFTGMKPVEQRNSDEAYLSDDVSFIIAHNKKVNETVEIFSLLSYTNVNVLPFTEDIPLEVIAFLDPTVEKLCFEQTEGKTFIHLKFKDEEEIILNNAADLEQYLSSGTIKGIITFSMVKEVLRSGGYLLVDEIENHFRFENRSLFGNFNVNAGVNLDYVTYTNRTFQKIFSEQAKEILYETDLNLFKWGVFATAGYESPDERFTASLGVRFDANTYSSKIGTKMQGPKISKMTAPPKNFLVTL